MSGETESDEDSPCCSLGCCSCCECCNTNQHVLAAKKHFVPFLLPNFGMTIALSIFSTLVPVSMKAMGETTAVTGVVCAMSGLGRLLADVPTSVLSHKIGPYWVILLSSILMTVFYALPCIDYRLWAFFVALGLGGVPGAGFATARLEIWAASLPKGERNILTNFIGAGARFSYLVGPLIGGVMYTHVGPVYGYLSSIGFYGFCFITVLIATPTLKGYSDKMMEARLEAERKKAEIEAIIEKRDARKRRQLERQRQRIINSLASTTFGIEDGSNNNSSGASNNVIIATPTLAVLSSGSIGSAFFGSPKKKAASVVSFDETNVASDQEGSSSSSSGDDDDEQESTALLCDTRGSALTMLENAATINNVDGSPSAVVAAAAADDHGGRGLLSSPAPAAAAVLSSATTPQSPSSPSVPRLPLFATGGSSPVQTTRSLVFSSLSQAAGLGGERTPPQQQQSKLSKNSLLLSPPIAMSGYGATASTIVLSAATLDEDDKSPNNKKNNNKGDGGHHDDDDAGHFAVVGTTAAGAAAATSETAPLVAPRGASDHHHHHHHHHHHASVWEALQAHWKIVVAVGLLALSVTALRQARRLALAFRALDLGYSAKQMGYVIALSFSIDTLFFWVASVVSNRFGYRAAVLPLCALYCAAFVILSFNESDSDNTTLLISAVVFGVADTCGAGTFLGIVGEMCPKATVGAARAFVDAGVLLGPLITGSLTHGVGLSWACRILAWWCLVAFLACFAVLPTDAGKVEGPISEEEERRRRYVLPFVAGGGGSSSLLFQRGEGSADGTEARVSSSSSPDASTSVTPEKEDRETVAK